MLGRCWGGPCSVQRKKWQAGSGSGNSAAAFNESLLLQRPSDSLLGALGPPCPLAQHTQFQASDQQSGKPFGCTMEHTMVQISVHPPDVLLYADGLSW